MGHMHIGMQFFLFCSFVAQALSFQSLAPVLHTKRTFPTSHPFHPLPSIHKQAHANFQRKRSIQSSRNIVKSFHLSLLSNDSALAISTIIISSGAGMLSDRIKVLGGGAGTVVSLASAAIISNVGLFGLSIPTSHRVYDICWSRLLPASLALVLISSDNQTKGLAIASRAKAQETMDSHSKNDGNNLQRETVIACGVPFVIGSIGSTLGCILSAIIMVQFGNSGSSMIGMNPFEAAVAAGCLCASYIGGSVNFFATANIISSQMASRFPIYSREMISDLISAMAAADLIVMALYFVGLSTMLSVKRLRSTFPGRQRSVRGDGLEVDDKHDGMNTSVNKIEKEKVVRVIGSGVLTTILVISIVEVTNSFERATSNIVPGLGCAAVATIAMSVNKILESVTAIIARKESRMSRFASDFWNDLKQIGGPMSDFCFMTLFAAIGVSADLKSAMTQGCSSFIFAILALMVHFLALGVGSFSVMTILPKFIKRSSTIFPLGLEEILVASNAAIGGASTAAGFAGNISGKHITKQYKRGLIVSATFWGVVGYGVATTIGVFLTRVLAASL